MGHDKANSSEILPDLIQVIVQECVDHNRKNDVDRSNDQPLNNEEYKTKKKCIIDLLF